MYRKIQLYLISTVLLLSANCTAVLLTGASGGVAYTFTNVAYKTVWYPISEVQYAIHRALDRMDIKELSVRKTESGVEIDAETVDLRIYIDLDRITDRTTKITVDARKSFVLKDKSTSAAIIDQTEIILNRGSK